MKLNFNNADFYRDNNSDLESTDLSKFDNDSDLIGIHSKLLITDAQGIYIPKCFVENFDLKQWNIDENSSDVEAILAGPDHEWYWEAWHSITNNAKMVDSDGNEWFLVQDGDLFTQCYFNKEN